MAKANEIRAVPRVKSTTLYFLRVKSDSEIKRKGNEIQNKMNTNCLQPQAVKGDYKERGERNYPRKKNASMESNLKDSQKTTASFLLYDNSLR